MGGRRFSQSASNVKCAHYEHINVLLKLELRHQGSPPKLATSPAGTTDESSTSPTDYPRPTPAQAPQEEEPIAQGQGDADKEQKKQRRRRSSNPFHQSAQGKVIVDKTVGKSGAGGQGMRISQPAGRA